MRCEVIHNGVDTDHYQPNPRRREECREELGVAKEQILAVMVARLTERKGIEQFMRALSLTSDKQVVGMVAGEGDDRKRLEALYIELELGSRFKFLGELADPRSLLAAADLGVLPSRGEGLPLCVMEMLSSGLPVAVSDIPEHAAFSSLSDAVSTFSLGSAEELGSLFDLGQVWREPARREHARAQAVERFGFDRMLEEYIQAYERTMR